ncbi:MAG: hypothetical protein P1U62_10160 [Alteraurantiacibacter sp. bin_em_oilr2.035]|nr:hypothetical protein [Alteraurantiacibacter sp. bin_em_oilr2.035]
MTDIIHKSHFPRALRLATAALASLGLVACATALPSQVRGESLQTNEPGPEASPTYADIVTYALEAELVAIVNIDDQTVFPPERAPDVTPDRVRLYLEALTRNLLASPTGVGESLIFVTDVDREADGDPPALKRRDFVIFADLVPGRPGEVRLVSSRAMFASGPAIEGRVRSVLRQLAENDVPPAVTGVRDVISVPGNLVGESETQMFVETQSGAPISMTVVRRPGLPPQWGVSLGEIVDVTARPPEPDTVLWYRLACSLPDELADDAFLQSDRSARTRAREDYAFVLADLGPCERRFS